MKKLLAFIGAVILMLSFTACVPPAEQSEIPDDPKTEFPEQVVSFSFWDWQIGTAGDAASLAKQIKSMGFTGADVTFRWNSLEYAKDSYSFRYIDAVLDEFVAEGLYLSTSLMFWSIGLPWMDEIEWQKLPDGTVYEFSGRGATPSFSDEKTVQAMKDAYDAFTAHIYGRYEKQLFRMHARSSQYGELEYYCDAPDALDYGEPAINAFREYLAELHKTPEGLNGACSGDREFTSLTDLNELTGKELSELFYFDWQTFRQSECLELASALRDIQHKNAPDVPFALQIGCIWDHAAVTRRGIVDPYLASLSCDILHTDDGPNFPHDFSMDYIGVNPETKLASEIDGRWHPTIQAMIAKGDKSLAPYVTQARHMGRKGIAYLNTANWSGAEIQEFSEPLSRYPSAFFQAERRAAADKTVAILLNTTDIFLQKIATTALYQATFNRLSESGEKQVRFVTDTQLLAEPELLSEIDRLYTGNAVSAAYYMSAEFAGFLAERNITLYTENDPSSFEIKDEYGHVLAGNAAPVFAKA